MWYKLSFQAFAKRVKQSEICWLSYKGKVRGIRISVYNLVSDTMVYYDAPIALVQSVPDLEAMLTQSQLRTERLELVDGVLGTKKEIDGEIIVDYCGDVDTLNSLLNPNYSLRGFGTSYVSKVEGNGDACVYTINSDFGNPALQVPCTLTEPELKMILKCSDNPDYIDGVSYDVTTDTLIQKPLDRSYGTVPETQVLYVGQVYDGRKMVWDNAFITANLQGAQRAASDYASLTVGQRYVVKKRVLEKGVITKETKVWEGYPVWEFGVKGAYKEGDYVLIKSRGGHSSREIQKVKKGETEAVDVNKSNSEINKLQTERLLARNTSVYTGADNGLDTLDERNFRRVALYRRYYMWYVRSLWQNEMAIQYNEDPTWYMKRGQSEKYIQSKSQRLKAKKGDDNWQYVGIIHAFTNPAKVFSEFPMLKRNDDGTYPVRKNSPIYCACCFENHATEWLHLVWNVSKYDIDYNFLESLNSMTAWEIIDALRGKQDYLLPFGETCLTDFFEMSKEQGAALAQATNTMRKEYAELVGVYISDRDNGTNYVENNVTSFAAMDRLMKKAMKYEMTAWNGNGYATSDGELLPHWALMAYSEMRKEGVYIPESLIRLIRDSIVGWYCRKFVSKVLRIPRNDIFAKNLGKLYGKRHREALQYIGNLSLSYRAHDIKVKTRLVDTMECLDNYAIPPIILLLLDEVIYRPTGVYGYGKTKVLAEKNADGKVPKYDYEGGHAEKIRTEYSWLQRIVKGFQTHISDCNISGILSLIDFLQFEYKGKRMITTSDRNYDTVFKSVEDVNVRKALIASFYYSAVTDSNLKFFRSYISKEEREAIPKISMKDMVVALEDYRQKFIEEVDLKEARDLAMKCLNPLYDLESQHILKQDYWGNAEFRVRTSYYGGTTVSFAHTVPVETQDKLIATGVTLDRAEVFNKLSMSIESFRKQIIPGVVQAMEDFNEENRKRNVKEQVAVDIYSIPTHHKRLYEPDIIKDYNGVEVEHLLMLYLCYEQEQSYIPFIRVVFDKTKVDAPKPATPVQPATQSATTHKSTTKSKPTKPYVSKMTDTMTDEYKAAVQWYIAENKDKKGDPDIVKRTGICYTVTKSGKYSPKQQKYLDEIVKQWQAAGNSI